MLSLRSLLSQTEPQLILPTIPGSMHGAGVVYKNHRFLTHSTLPLEKSAFKTFHPLQKLWILCLILALVDSVISFGAMLTAIGLVAILTVIYFTDVLFNAYLITRSLRSKPEIDFTQEEIDSIYDEKLPIYTILCPLYKEGEVLPQFVEAIKNLDWPKDKLEVLLLLEEDDLETQKVAENLLLPDYFNIVIVPDSQPKTKPKATNYGLHLATGKYIVIYDAEDKPDYLQLKKAYLAFQKYGGNIACFQAKLNYYNASYNLLTKFFTAEYSLWFGLILPGLQSLNTTIPLGGTSNHFKTETLRQLYGWDPFNVTEDCDLGVRLFKVGYKTAIINSTTYEEANSQLGNWLRQRSRWIKGYLQTFLVHNRDLAKFATRHKHHFLIFQLIVGGKIAFAMINPFMWLATIAYFAMRSTLGPIIEQFFPLPIFYLAVTCLVLGNFLYLYYYMIGLVKHEKFELIKYILFVPAYWAMISTAFWIAIWQLVLKPHYWEKTVHGFDFIKRRRLNVREQRETIIRPLYDPATAAGAVLVFAAIVANFANFAYNAYLARKISIEEFGLVSLISSFLFLSTIPLNALSRTVTHKSAYYLGKYKISIHQFWQQVRSRAIAISIIITILWVAATPILETFFNAHHWLPFVLFAPVWIISTAQSVDSGFLNGNFKFKFLAILIVTEAMTKIFVTWLLVNIGFSRYVYAAIPISLSVGFLLAWFFARSIKETKVEIARRLRIKFPLKFYTTAIFTKISAISFLSFDLILAKHYLPPTEAGQYALLSLAGKMIFFIGGLFSQFILPLVSREEGAQRDSKIVFYKIFLASTTVSFLTYVGIGLFGFISAPILFGDKVKPILYLLPIYGLAIFCFTVANSILTFYQAKNKHLFASVSLLLAISLATSITLFHSSLSQIVWVMAAVGFMSLAVMALLHFKNEIPNTLLRNVSDFLGIFKNIPEQPSPNLTLSRILIFNWRDTKHVWAGGAEVYLHEIAKRLVQMGHQVTIFCGNDGKSSKNDIIDGVNIIRRGGFYTVYFWAPIYYLCKLRKNVDLVLDSENGIPFFTPLFVKKPKIGLVHHVHQEVFRTKLKFPLAQIGKFLEGKLMPFIYQNVQMVTVSASSKADMQKIGLGKKYPIEIISPGVDLLKFQPAPKTPNPSVLYLGRLQPYKTIQTAIYAMQNVIKNIPNATLTIAGSGEVKDQLQKLVEILGLTSVVKFIGTVDEKTKVELFAKSWVMVQPSKIEGWGITAIEANASGTPVVAANVAGLRDSVSNPHSGFLVPWGDVEKFAEKIELILLSSKVRSQLEIGSRLWAQQFDWQKSTQKLLSVADRLLFEKSFVGSELGYEWLEEI